MNFLSEIDPNVSFWLTVAVLGLLVVVIGLLVYALRKVSELKEGQDRTSSPQVQTVTAYTDDNATVAAITAAIFAVYNAESPKNPENGIELPFRIKSIKKQ